MRPDDPVATLAACLHSAALKDLPEVNGRRPHAWDCEVFAMFLQTWGDTSLGFGGVGGQAMTPAYTTIITDLSNFAVYFGGRLAYVIGREKLNIDVLHRDINQRNMAPVGDRSRYKFAPSTGGER